MAYLHTCPVCKEKFYPAPHSVQGCARHWAEIIADYLLANGVIVPPCKVGDTVYFAEYGYHNEAEIEDIRIDENGIMFSWTQYDVGVDITEVWDDGEFTLEDIGKTVFLTREEAEQKLRGDPDCCERLDLVDEPILCDECYLSAKEFEEEGDE